MSSFFKRRPATAYFILVYIWSFVIFSSLFLINPQGVDYFINNSSKINPLPLFILFIGGLGPSLLGIILTYKSEGTLKRLINSALPYKQNIKWYLFVIFIPAICAFLARFSFLTYSDISPIDYSILLPNILIGLVAGFIEEFGWRGFALPRLQKNTAPFFASLILGFFWGLWHLAASYWAVGEIYEKTFGVYFIVTSIVPLISYSLLMTYIYNKTKGNLFLSILFHMSISTAVSTFITKMDSNVDYITLNLFYALITMIVSFLFTFGSKVMWNKIDMINIQKKEMKITEK